RSGIEVDRVCRVDAAVQRAVDRGLRAAGRRRQHGEVLQVVGSGVGVVQVVCGGAVLVQIDSDRRIHGDAVAANGVAGGGGSGAGDADPEAAPSNSVAGSGSGAAKRVPRRVLDVNRPAAVGNIRRGGDVRADQVALHDCIDRAGPNLNTRAVARDEIARPGGGSADGRVGCVDDVDADARVAERHHAGDVGAYEVALDDGAACGSAAAHRDRVLA